MALKKAELHTHLEGTITPRLAKMLAKRNAATLPESLITPDGNSYTYCGFLDFLKTYDQVADLIKNPIDYYDITLDYLQSNAEKGAIYIEMMYSPDHAEKVSGLPSSEHLVAIGEAIEAAYASHQIVGRILITGVRHFGVDAVERVAAEAIGNPLPFVTGFGLGGDEAGFPPRLFKRAYDIAASGGLGCTIHAGEHAPASGMIEAMDYLPIQRIGHGVLGIHSPETLARLKDKQIALEVCPSSNVSLGLFPDVAHHPIAELAAMGISVSINSDDPPFFRTTLSREYDLVQETFEYTDAQMHHFTAMAIDSAFVDPQTKQQLRDLL